jgi:hypothetical protein
MMILVGLTLTALECLMLDLHSRNIPCRKGGWTKALTRELTRAGCAVKASSERNNVLCATIPGYISNTESSRSNSEPQYRITATRQVSICPALPCTIFRHSCLLTVAELCSVMIPQISQLAVARAVDAYARSTNLSHESPTV